MESWPLVGCSEAAAHLSAAAAVGQFSRVKSRRFKLKAITPRVSIVLGFGSTGLAALPRLCLQIAIFFALAAQPELLGGGDGGDNLQAYLLLRPPPLGHLLQVVNEPQVMADSKEAIQLLHWWPVCLFKIWRHKQAD